MLVAISCAGDQATDPTTAPVSDSVDTGTSHDEPATETPGDDCNSDLGREIDSVFTPHFQLWIQEHTEYDGLTRTDLVGGSFGGLINGEDCVLRTPVIFVHGNSDRALGGLFDGWSDALPEYLRDGYRSGELYATTYGNPDLMTADEYTHGQVNVMQVRRMFEAVLEYTASDTVNIVAHSLGVTMARRAILGGIEYDVDGSIYDIGAPLTESVGVFIGIAGANLGLASCTFPITDVCGDDLGLYPGNWINGDLENPSSLLETLNESEHYEGRLVYSVWGEADGLLGQDTVLDCLLYGFNTCRIPGQDDEYNQYLNHFDVRDETVDMQIHFLRSE